MEYTVEAVVYQLDEHCRIDISSSRKAPPLSINCNNIENALEQALEIHKECIEKANGWIIFMTENTIIYAVSDVVFVVEFSVIGCPEQS